MREVQVKHLMVPSLLPVALAVILLTMRRATVEIRVMQVVQGLQEIPEVPDHQEIPVQRATLVLLLLQFAEHSPVVLVETPEMAARLVTRGQQVLVEQEVPVGTAETALPEDVLI